MVEDDPTRQYLYSLPFPETLKEYWEFQLAVKLETVTRGLGPEYAPVAQWIEHQVSTLSVGGSSPLGRTFLVNYPRSPIPTRTRFSLLIVSMLVSVDTLFKPLLPN